MPQILSQDFSYHYLVDPTPNDPLTQPDYLDPANDKTVYRVTGYSYNSVQNDLNRLFPSGVPNNWAEKYFHWWMERKQGDITEIDPYFYEAVDRGQWNGDWSIGSPYRLTVVKIDVDEEVRWLKKTEFEQEVKEKGFYSLAGFELHSWDEILEIAATFPTPLGKIRLGPSFAVTEEKIVLYRRGEGKKTCRISDSPNGPLKSADLPQGEMRFWFEADRAERVKLPGSAGWLALDYEKGAVIKAYFNLQSHRAAVENGMYLLAFDGVSVSLRPELILDLLKEQYGVVFLPELVSFVAAVVGSTKDTYRLPVKGVVLFGGRPHLELDLSAHPWIGDIFPFPLFIDLSLASDCGLPLPEGLPGDVIGNSSFRLQSDLNSYLLLKTAEEMMKTVREEGAGNGLISSLLPSSYSGEVKFRSINGGYLLDSPHPILGEQARIDDGAFRIDFNSQGAYSVEGHLPVRFLRNAGDEEGRTLSAELDFRVKTDETGQLGGWMEAHSDELPILLGGAFDSAEANISFSDVSFNPKAGGPEDLLARMVNEFEVQLIRNDKSSVFVQGGGVYTHEDSQIYVSGDGNILSLLGLPVNENDVSVSWNGMPGVKGKNFEFSGFSFPLMDGLEFAIEDVIGTYQKNSDRTVMDVKGVFRFTAMGPFMADESVFYEGKIVWNPKKQTITMVDLDVPLADLALNFRQGEEKFPFIFSGRLTGQLRIDLRKGVVTGPFALNGDLYYLEDARESGIAVLPLWLQIDGPFEAHIPFNGVIYNPAERGDLKTAADVIQKNRHSSRVQAIEGITFQVNSFSRDKKNGSISADLMIDLESVGLVSPATDSPGAMDDPPAVDGEKPVQDPPEPLIIRSRRETLDPLDIYLDAYGLDREKAEMMLTMLRNSEEAVFSLTGFRINRTGSPFLKVPDDAVPQIDVRVVEGRVQRFHLYFSKPIGIPPLVRGVYFDGGSGKFRLDLINNGDGRRPPDFYRLGRGDPDIGKMLFRLLPLSTEVVDGLSAQTGLDPASVTDDASVWLEFFLLTLVALEEHSIDKMGETARNENPVGLDHAKVVIDSMRLKPGTTLSMYGTQFEIGCDHNALKDGGVNHGDNLLSGTIDLGKGIFRLRMDNLDKLHIFVPGNEGSAPLMDLMLRDGKIGEIEMKREEGETVLRIADMDFARSGLTGKPFEENLDLRVISNFRMNEMAIRQSAENDQTVITTDFSADVQSGHLHFKKGKRRADFEMEPSSLHVKSSIRFDDVIRTASGEYPYTNFPFMPSDKSALPMIDTVLTASEFDITSKELAYSQVRLAPGIVFGRSVTRDAHIVLKSGYGGEGDLLNLTGNFDWRMNQPFPVPLARIQLIPRLVPVLEFESMSLSGPGQLKFDDERVYFGKVKEDEEVPEALKGRKLLVNYSGTLSVEHVPIADQPSFVTRLSGRFEGTHEYREGMFSIEESGEGFPLHVREMTAEDMVINIHDLNGIIYTESPSPAGVSAWSFVDGSGVFSAVEAHLEEAGRADFTGMQLQLYDAGPHRNFVIMEGNLKVRDKVTTFEDLNLEAELYDELNKSSMKGIKIKSRSPVAWLWSEPPSEPPTGYPLFAI
ncbi:MAG: hypothetical protein HY541_08690 [Deltaproteobacteria bacterium]|nr:hypothetical protein [Deltaproteobacteria bacterium]